jgi:predicted kinase
VADERLDAVVPGLPGNAQGIPVLVVLITGLPGSGKSTMAEVAGRALGAPVLGHDWAMSGLRPFPELQDALDAMGQRGHRGVGWSLLWALARSQLRLGSSVVLDGVARGPEVEETRRVAAEEGAGSLAVMTSCRDAGLHRGRVEGRQRQILESALPVEENAERLRLFLATRS